MSYLIHFNPNHNPKDGRFTFSPRAMSRANVKLYKKMQKVKQSPDASSQTNAERYASQNKYLRSAVKNDKKLQESYENLKNTKPGSKALDEPKWQDDDYTVNLATKMFKKDWPDWDKDPSVHKMFGYYLEDASEKSKTFAKKVKEFEKAMKEDPWNQAYDKYTKEAERAAKEFTGKLADKPFQGNEYYPYSSAIRFSIYKILEEDKNSK